MNSNTTTSEARANSCKALDARVCPPWPPAENLLCTEAALVFHGWVRQRASRYFNKVPKRMRDYQIRWRPQDGAHYYIQQLLRALTTTSKSLLLTLHHAWKEGEAFNWSKGARCTLALD